MSKGTTASVPTEMFLAENATSQWVLTKAQTKPVGPNEVLIRFVCSGLCHTDIHMQKNDWKITTYPICAGHEGVGIVEGTGEKVKGIQVGDTVGVGWMQDSCGSCLACRRGIEQCCEKGYTGTILGNNSTGGTFSKHQVVNEKFCAKIPSTFPKALAAPLLCAGITVYAPLRKYVTPGMRVGIISAGGLGHLGIQIAKAMGAEVGCFTTSARKEQEIKAFGASEVIVTSNKGAFDNLKPFDLILNTCPFEIDVNQYVGALKNNGSFVFLGLPESGSSELKINLYGLVFGQKRLIGSLVGGMTDTTEMFEFCDANKILPSVEMVDFSTINETCTRLLKGDMKKYRFTLCWADQTKSLSEEVAKYTAK